MKVLVKFEADYADEFDVYGFQIMDKDKWLKYKAKLMDHEGTIEIYFGTNEAIVAESGEEFLYNYTVIGISGTESSHLEKLFPNGNYGNFLMWEY